MAGYFNSSKYDDESTSFLRGDCFPPLAFASLIKRGYIHTRVHTILYFLIFIEIGRNAFHNERTDP